MVAFLESFSILILTVVVLSFAVKFLRQPIIIGYVLAGLVFASFFASNIASEDLIILSELGITFLLFLMGMEFDLKQLRHLGRDLLIITTIQSIIFFGIGFGAASLFDFSVMERVHLAILFMFSSTLLVAKWLEDKKEISTLQGKVILGILIIQDVFAIILLTLLSILKEHSFTDVLIVPAKGFLLIALTIALSRFILPRPLKFASKFPELLFV